MNCLAQGEAALDSSHHTLFLESSGSDPCTTKSSASLDIAQNQKKKQKLDISDGQEIKKDQKQTPKSKQQNNP